MCVRCTSWIFDMLMFNNEGKLPTRLRVFEFRFPNNGLVVKLRSLADHLSLTTISLILNPSALRQGVNGALGLSSREIEMP